MYDVSIILSTDHTYMDFVSDNDFSSDTIVSISVYQDSLAGTFINSYELTAQQLLQLQTLGRVSVLLEDVFGLLPPDAYYILLMEGDDSGTSNDIDYASVDQTESLVWSQTELTLRRNCDQTVSENLFLAKTFLDYMKQVPYTTKLNSDFYKRKDQIDRIFRA